MKTNPEESTGLNKVDKLKKELKGLQQNIKELTDKIEKIKEYKMSKLGEERKITSEKELLEYYDEIYDGIFKESLEDENGDIDFEELKKILGEHFILLRNYYDVIQYMTDYQVDDIGIHPKELIDINQEIVSEMIQQGND